MSTPPPNPSHDHNSDHDSDTEDSNFRARLASLPTPSLPTEDELAARFSKLFLRTPTGAPLSLPKTAPTPPEKEDQELTDLSSHIKELQKEWTVDESEVDALLEEAAGLIGEGEGDGEVPHWLRDDSADAPTGIWGDEEDEIVRRIREEVEWERRHGIVEGGDKEVGDNGGKEEEEEGDDELARRFQALETPGGGFGGLELPAAPRALPGAKVARKEQGVNEVDTWCCICNEDAEYRCDGCDGDIYCKECLYEAHTGPDAGFEERRHRWTKYVRPKKIIAAA